MVTSSAVSRSVCVVYDDRRQARIQLARMFAEVPGVRRVIPVSSVDGLVSLAGEPGAVVVVGTRRPASVGADAIRRVLALRSGAAVVVVGGDEDACPVSSAVAAGAVGFLRWDAAPVLVRTLVDSLAGADSGRPPCSTPDDDGTRRVVDHASGPPPVSPADGCPGGYQAGCTVPSDLGISRRELQILHGISRGFSNRELSRQLELSENTVKSHVRRLFSRLGVHERAHAVARAYRLGLFAHPLSGPSTGEGGPDRAARLAGRPPRRVPDQWRMQPRPVSGVRSVSAGSFGGAETTL